jgi:carbamoyltransferase
MIRWGINALNHGSSLAVFDDARLISNRFYTSDELDIDTIEDALRHGAPSRIYWYERPIVKKLRQIRARQWNRALDLSVMPRNYLSSIGLKDIPVIYTPHHASHAAAGYYTSPFDDCAVVVLDAIGEWECATIWHGKDDALTKLWSRNYPNSLGLFYSAFTDLIGFVPVQEEFKLQQLSMSGDPDRYHKEIRDYFNGVIGLRKNLHKGVIDWPYEITDDDKRDIAAAVQRVFEEQISLTMTLAQKLTDSDRLVYMGGCAMNSLANKKLVETRFGKIWSLPQPGDPSSSIGAVLYHTKQRPWNYDPGIVKHIEVRV